MARKGSIDTDQIKRAHPLAEVISRYGVKLRRQGSNLMGLCPFHEDTRPSLSVDPEVGLWYCFGCGLGGDVITFVQEMEGVEFLEACEILTGGRLPKLRRPLPTEWVQAPKPKPPERRLTRAEKAVLDLAIRVYHTTLVVGPKGPDTPYGYLLARGLTVETIQEFQVGYCSGRALMPALRYVRLGPKHAETIGLLRRADRRPRANRRPWEFFTGRITFVERDRTGRVIHMAGRALTRSKARYLFLPDLSKPVYGLSQVDFSDPVFVVEGIFDYITLRQWGYQAVATLGTSLKRKVARRLTRAPTVIFVPDNDEGGAAALARWRETVGHGVALRLPDGVGDVNDLMDQQRPQHKFRQALATDVVLLATTIEDYVTLWRWGYQTVAVMNGVRKQDSGWLGQATSVVFVPSAETEAAQVDRWAQALQGSLVLALPKGRDVHEVSREEFDRLLMTCMRNEGPS